MRLLPMFMRALPASAKCQPMAALMSRMRPSRAGVSVGAAFAVMLVVMVVMPS
jgi:hypothetical protein